MITVQSTTAPKRKAPDALRAAAAERMKQMHKSISSNRFWQTLGPIRIDYRFELF